jgi:gamma-glutamyltranspeptidase
LQWPALARTVELIAIGGARAFYKGKAADVQRATPA